MRALTFLLAALVIYFTFFQSKINAQLPIMNVSIVFVPHYYIIVSDKLWEGIFYTNETGAAENVQYPLLSGSENNNAVWNYNKSNQKTEYWIFFGGNVAGDICHGATNHLCSNPGCLGADNVQINISYAKWSSSLTNDKDNPSLSVAKPFVIGFDNENKVSANTQPNTIIYLRYWLTVPPATPAKNYNTTYQIRVVPAGESCV
jgi:hypothetical protein